MSAVKGQKSRQNPTFKQKKAVEKVLEGMPIKKAMESVGYAPSTVNNTGKLTRSKAWEELMEKYIPDSLLTEKHLALLNKEEVVVRNNVTSGEIETIPTGEIDVNSVSKGLDMAYKLKRKYPIDKGDSNKILIVNVSGETNTRYSLSTPQDTETSSS